jgi:L-lactate dehydrogenase (cytochrome)
MTVITNVEDLRVLAQRRVPRMFYDYADSGSWTESTYRANQSDFQKIKLRQRVAVNMENRSTATKMVGVDVKMPVAIAPVGLTGMQHADGEILAAKAAEKFGIRSRCQHDEHLLDRGRGRGDDAAVLVPALRDARPRASSKA